MEERKLVGEQYGRSTLSALWTVVVLNMVFADLVSFVTPGYLQEVVSGSLGGIRPTPNLLLVFALLLEIPISMILLSRILSRRLVKLASTPASVLTIGFVIAGGVPYLHYYFFATVEIACLLVVAWLPWTWIEGKKP